VRIQLVSRFRDVVIQRFDVETALGIVRGKLIAVRRAALGSSPDSCTVEGGVLQ
jgi:hypothetical protein